MSDHRDDVAQAKADLIAHGVDVSGECGAFAICVLAARRIPGAGLKKKPTGTNCLSHSIKSIMFANGDDFLVLLSPGTTNEPHWEQFGQSPPELFTPPGHVNLHWPFESPSQAPAPDPTPTPDPSPSPTPLEPSDDRVLLDRLVKDLDSLIAVVAAVRVEVSAANERLQRVIESGVRVHF